jgi:rhodanese-related sulfurtransferase/glyoxylase-like metal-dependent hydrolase (beta-lactamase superfamily II)
MEQCNLIEESLRRDARREAAVAATQIVPVVDEGLGNSSYLADVGDGRALAIDVSRDLRAMRAAADRRALRVGFAAETHLHADFLSGACQLAADDGAEIIGPAAGHRMFTHRGLADGDDLDLGGLTLRAWATPGHTAEHLCYLLLDGGQVLAVFTGGSLLVGAAARTDLAGREQAEPLARAQYASLRRLAALPDDTPVYPTHGAGSFCSAPPGAERTTSIGREKATNPLLAAPDEDAFVKALLASLGTFPPYFLRLAEENRRGPAVLTGEPELAALPADRVQALMAGGAQVIDVRPVDAYTSGHIPGSLAIPLREVFATWLGWLIPRPSTPLVFVRDPGQDPGEIAWQALKIGYANLAGELAGGLPAWAAAGQPVAATALITPGQVSPAAVIDVRQDSEYAGGHLPGARNIELGALPRQAAALNGQRVVTMCGHGERAATAASVLERAGHTGVAILPGGPPDWSQATGLPLAAGA